MSEARGGVDCTSGDEGRANVGLNEHGFVDAFNTRCCHSPGGADP